MEGITRKEWKAWKKRIKRLVKKYHKTPDACTNVERMELIEYFNESERQYDAITDRNRKICYVCWGITAVAMIISIIFQTLTYLKKKDRTEKTVATIAAMAENTAATADHVEDELDFFADFSAEAMAFSDSLFAE